MLLLVMQAFNIFVYPLQLFPLLTHFSILMSLRDEFFVSPERCTTLPRYLLLLSRRKAEELKTLTGWF